jgi:hypothetical protein
MKVLIYSTKELYDNSSFEGRAEAHLIAYADKDRYTYTVMKDRYGIVGHNFISKLRLGRIIDLHERQTNDSPFIPELTH